MARRYLFVGGPLDGLYRATDGRLVWYVAVPPPLEDLLEASITIAEKGMAPVPPMKRGIYRMAEAYRDPDSNVVPFDPRAYVYQGEE
jgi:hypothetical protein